MNATLPFFVVGLLASSMYLLSSSRLNVLIKTIAFQGLLLTFVPFAVGEGISSTHAWILGCISLVVKTIVIPVLLFRALRGLGVVKELQPYVGYSLSMAVGVLIVTLSFAGYKMISVSPVFTSSLLPAAFTVAFTGLFLIIARKQALTQILGYLVFENGIYLFGIALSVKSSLIVELGILLDILVAVFVMGVVIHHIYREFDTISTHTLDTLRE